MVTHINVSQCNALHEDNRGEKNRGLPQIVVEKALINIQYFVMIKNTQHTRNVRELPQHNEDHIAKNP